MNKSNGNDDGHFDIAELEDFKPEGAILDKNDLESTFKTPEHTDTTRLLLTPGNVGDDLAGLIMRTDFPSYSIMLAIASLLRKCEKHKNKPRM